MTILLYIFVELEGNDFDVLVSVPGIPTAGDNFTMNCTGTGPDRLVITPSLTWQVEVNGMTPVDVTLAEATIGTVTIGDLVVTGSATFSRTLTFTAVRTSQARPYSCNIFFSGIVSKSDFGDLHVRSKYQTLVSNTAMLNFLFSLLCFLFFV